jgi:hypothetical protein
MDDQPAAHYLIVHRRNRGRAAVHRSSPRRLLILVLRVCGRFSPLFQIFSFTLFTALPPFNDPADTRCTLRAAGRLRAQAMDDHRDLHK